MALKPDSSAPQQPEPASSPPGAEGSKEPLLGAGAENLPRWIQSAWQQIKDPPVLGVVVFLAGLAPVWALSHAGIPRSDYFDVDQLQQAQLAAGLTNALIGWLAGVLLILVIYLFRRRLDLAVAVLGLVTIFVLMRPGLGAILDNFAIGIGFIVGLVLAWRRLFTHSRGIPKTFGSAEWADEAHIATHKHFDGEGFWLGNFPVPGKRRSEPPTQRLLRYNGERHLLTVAPTRSGKGVSAIVPNLLTYEGSVLCIDPKGENAMITAVARGGMKQAIYIVDPWEIATPRFKDMRPACFNPLDWLRVGDPDLNENALLIADALIVPSAESRDRFWDEESKALLMGLILFVATDAEEQGKRHLGRVRDLLMLADDALKAMLQHMYRSDHPVVSSTGARTLQKNPQLLSNVLAAAQSHTHFLDSPRIRESLSHSDFDFALLKRAPMTIYLVLPADRLNTYGRWLRLLVQQAITVNARNIDRKPAKPVLFMLDEMAALGQLTMVEQAFSLMAGFGMQLWGIVQDLSQLERIYGKGWQTFVSNSGVIQYFGSRDEMSASYFSKLAGVTTIVTLSSSFARAFSSGPGGGSSSTTTSESQQDQQRNLAYPDELMRLPDDKQLILIENMNPISATKIEWHSHPELAPLGISLHSKSD